MTHMGDPKMDGNGHFTQARAAVSFDKNFINVTTAGGPLLFFYRPQGVGQLYIIPSSGVPILDSTCCGGFATWTDVVEIK